MEKFIEKYKSYSSKVLQKLAKVKTGDELDAIESILASRGASQEHPAEEGAVYNATETEEYKAENGIKENDEVAEGKPKKARKTKTQEEPKEPRLLKKEISDEEPKEPRLLKKEISDEGAKANLENAKANIGRFCKFICTKTKEQTDGIIIGARLDPRNNFIQYRIKTNDGHVWGKGIDSKDLELGEMAPVPEETEKPKRGRKKAAPEAAPEAEHNEPENAPAEE